MPRASLRAVAFASPLALALSSVARADFTGVSVEVMDFSQGYVTANGSLYSGDNAAAINQLVADRWATFSNDMVVLRFYATFSNPADRMIFFGSTELQPLDLVIQTPPGRQFFEPNTFDIFPPFITDVPGNVDLAFDSWLTIGAADWQDVPQEPLALFATPTMPTSMLDGLSIPAARDGIAMVPTFEDGEINPLSLPDAQGRVLFAQLSVHRGTRFGFTGSLAYFPSGAGLEVERTFVFASVPGPGTLALAALAGLAARARRRRCARS